MSEISKKIPNLVKCICVKCPSYTFACMVKALPGNVMALAGGLSGAEHLEGMFCAFEKSRCITEDKGCICPKCALYTENKLDKRSYCLSTGGK